MVSLRGQEKAWATPRSVSFRGLIQNFRRASPPLSYAESPRGFDYTDCPCFEVKDEEDLLLEKTVRWYKTGRGKRQGK